MDLQLTRRRAVVTGGSRGIGRAIASALAAEGCDVGLVARDVAATEAAAAELAASWGRRVISLPADTGDDAAVVTFLASPLSVALTGDAIAAGGGTLGPIHY
ncbi:MAG: SDR family NAD(P)-dependent oxidoreductase [Solirubrobacteraceae bacterium]